MMPFKRGDKVYDKTRRRVCYIKRAETHDRFNIIWWVVQYRDGFVRNVFSEELKLIKEKN